MMKIGNFAASANAGDTSASAVGPDWHAAKAVYRADTRPGCAARVFPIPLSAGATVEDRERAPVSGGAAHARTRGNDVRPTGGEGDRASGRALSCDGGESHELVRGWGWIGRAAAAAISWSVVHAMGAVRGVKS